MTPENKEKTNLEKPEKPAESSEGGSGFLSLSDLEPSKLHTASAGSASLSAVRHESFYLVPAGHQQQLL